MGRHGAVGDDGQPQMRKARRFEQAVERADQQHDKADQRDQRADFLAEPDLVVGRPRRAALQGLGEPVEAVADRLMRNVLGRMGDRGRVEHPRGAVRRCRHRPCRARPAPWVPNRAQSFGLWVTSRARSTPHIRLENSSYCANTSATLRGQFGGAVGGERFAGRGSLQHHRFVVVRHRGRGGEHGPAAHRMAFEADIVLVDEVEAAQMRQPVRDRRSRWRRPAGRCSRGRSGRAPAPHSRGGRIRWQSRPGSRAN